jgi:predicted AAA+ superfamily ATPase
MNIKRYIEPALISKLKPNKVMVILGARRVGKTELLKNIKSQVQENVLFLNGDDIETHNILEVQSSANYMRILGETRFLMIDEAQEIQNIGKKLKLMVDTIPGLKIMITGSSAFELNNQIGEPLVGRMSVMHLFPLAQLEFSQTENYPETVSNLEERLLYGGYPELLQLKSNTEKAEYLKNIVYSYLLKDILAFEGIKKRDKITALLQKLAFRSGSEISLENLGKELQISKNTVEKYLDLFTKVFICYSISGFSRNRDNEITKMKKWYFMDNGIRNALINNFNPLTIREDIGILWENYLNSERKKKLHYQQAQDEEFFWRTHSKQEIDRIEVSGKEIRAYEYKWGSEQAKIPSEFENAYPKAVYTTINKNNYLDFIV